MSVTLGLDLGPNSIGWALVDDTANKLIDLGVRIFPEGVDNFDTAKEKSRNEDRRTARGMRRQIARRARRKRLLREALIEAGLWPRDRQEQERLEATDPYALRARAVDLDAPTLSRYELGRVILHLNQRRGFLSNRKADPEKGKEASDMKAEMEGLDGELRTSNQTLGQFLSSRAARLHNPNPGDPVMRTQVANNLATLTEEQRVRRRHTKRAMLEHELERIAERHASILTPTLLYGATDKQPLKGREPRRKPKGQTYLQAFGLHGILFFQRALYWPKSMIGLCELEPKQPRCPRADRAAQRFRLLQEVNNLRYIDPDTNEERALSDEQRTLLLEKLAPKEKMEFDAIRRALGFLDSVRFNLERGKRPSLKGHITDFRMAKVVKDWHKRAEGEKDAIVRVLINPSRDDEAVKRRLLDEFHLKEPEADAALAADLPNGYVSLSLKAIERLLPHMERGLVYQMTDAENSAVHAAGYMRRDELQRRVFDTLPDPERTPHAPIGDIPNPVVRRALVELRKLVNAIIREYGKPDAIHVEMARDVKQGERARREYNSRIREREAERDAAAEWLRDHGSRVSRERINKYLLWKEQNHECVYCGQAISQAQYLSGGDTQVDHILPYSRCLDDSQMNKVICHVKCNADKGQRTPQEWLAASSPKQYESVCQRARSLPYPKYRRFLQKELELGKFIARQLVDTSYIARATLEYLRCLVDKPDHVLGLKGQLTHELRHQWGLNEVLNAEGLNLKTRDDHRHHAIDALVVALTDGSRLQQLTRIRKAGGVLQTGEALDLPWDGFREEVRDRINAVNVSHRAERKVAGALHEDTLYGQHKNDAGQVVPGEFVVRKPLEALSPSEVELIRDDAVRAAVMARLAEHGADIGRGKKVPPNVWKAALCDKSNPVRLRGKKTGTLGPPIYKVRVIRREQTIQPIRSDGHTAYVKPGSTHHLSLFEYEENGKTKREAVWTTMLEAANRLKRQTQLLSEAKRRIKRETGEKVKPRDPHLGREMRRIASEVSLITRKHPTRPDARFLFSLRRGEAVIADILGNEELLIYNTSASTQGQIYFFHHTDARPKSHKEKDRERRKYVFKASTLDARKVTVDYLGRVRYEEQFVAAAKPVDPDVAKLAKQRIVGEISQRALKRRLAELGKPHLGAQLTAELHRLRAGT